MNPVLIFLIAFAANLITCIPCIRRRLDAWELKHRLNLGAREDDPMIIHLRKSLKPCKP